MKKREKIDLEKTKFVNEYNKGEIEPASFVKKIIEIKKLNQSFMGINFLEHDVEKNDEELLLNICHANGITLNNDKKERIIYLLREEE